MGAPSARDCGKGEDELKMFMPIITRYLSLMIIAGAAALGCDRDAPAPVSAPSAPVRRSVEIRPVAPLLPARPTHVAVDARGNVFWSQEGESGDDVVFSLGDDGVPRGTRLTAASVLAETREAAGEQASGNIQSLAFGADGALYFYVSGGTERRTIAALGRFVPATSVIQLVAPTKQLTAASRMGRALALARGTVVASGNRIVLWLRHTDASAMLELVASGGTTQLKPAPPVQTDAGPLRLTRENQFLVPGRDGALLLLDLTSAELFMIDPAGKATMVHELLGLPRALSLPAVDARGRVLLVAGDAPAIDPRTEGQAALSMIEHPALLILDRDRVDVVSRKDIDAHAGFSLPGMKLQQLVPDRANDAFIGYDESSGELLRLRLRGEAKP